MQNKQLIEIHIKIMMQDQYSPKHPGNFQEAMIEGDEKKIARAVMHMTEGRYKEACDLFQEVSYEYWYDYCKRVVNGLEEERGEEGLH